MKGKSLIAWTMLIFLAGFAFCAVVTELQFTMTGTVKSQGPEDPLEAWSEADYIIWAYNSTYYASRNMSVNMVETFCDNLTYTCVMTDGNLSNGGLIWLKGVQKPAAYTPSANITVWESYQDNVKIYTATTSGKVGDCPTEVNGTHTHANSTSEQTLLEITPSVVTRLYNFYIDLTALNQNCTIKVYMKIDGSNYKEIVAMRLTNLQPTNELLALKEVWISATTDFKITMQSGTLEGTTRAIYYRYFKEEY